MSALNEFVAWLTTFVFQDKNRRLPPGLKLNIHSRSDEHSKKLAELVVQELVEKCGPLRDHALEGRIGYGINYRFSWPNGKTKTLDLLIGIPNIPLLPQSESQRVDLKPHRVARGAPGFSRVLISVELKSVLTEHKKSQPRVFDELNGSHAIVHAGDQLSIAGGLTLVNIANQFVSPLRQHPEQDLVVSDHDQPRVASEMVNHLRNLPRRTADNPIGFDAYSTFLVDIDNLGRVALWTENPAPQMGQPDHFDTFIADICREYSKRFGDLSRIPEPEALSYEDALIQLSAKHPGLLDETGQLAVDAALEGSIELQAILKAIEELASPSPQRSSQ
ncbi:hypothetical protein BH23CHL4_BH23CHL4_30550 [soil metagenome]